MRFGSSYLLFYTLSLINTLFPHSKVQFKCGTIFFVKVQLPPEYIAFIVAFLLKNNTMKGSLTKKQKKKQLERFRYQEPVASLKMCDLLLNIWNVFVVHSNLPFFIFHQIVTNTVSTKNTREVSRSKDLRFPKSAQNIKLKL